MWLPDGYSDRPFLAIIGGAGRTLAKIAAEKAAIKEGDRSYPPKEMA
jgi:hypothetical protein